MSLVPNVANRRSLSRATRFSAETSGPGLSTGLSRFGRRDSCRIRRRKVAVFGDRRRRFQWQSPNSATAPFLATVSEFGDRRRFRWQSPNSATIVASVDRAYACGYRSVGYRCPYGGGGGLQLGLCRPQKLRDAWYPLRLWPPFWQLSPLFLPLSPPFLPPPPDCHPAVRPLPPHYRYVRHWV